MQVFLCTFVELFATSFHLLSVFDHRLASIYLFWTFRKDSHELVILLETYW